MNALGGQSNSPSKIVMHKMRLPYTRVIPRTPRQASNMFHAHGIPSLGPSSVAPSITPPGITPPPAQHSVR